MSYEAMIHAAVASGPELLIIHKLPLDQPSISNTSFIVARLVFPIDFSSDHVVAQLRIEVIALLTREAAT